MNNFFKDMTLSIIGNRNILAMMIMIIKGRLESPAQGQFLLIEFAATTHHFTKPHPLAGSMLN